MSATGNRVHGGWRIAIVEDHLLQRLRTEDVVAGERAFEVVHSCETLAEHVQWLRARPQDQWPHLLVLDLVADRDRDADPDTVEVLLRGGTRVLVLSAMASPPLVRSMLRVGVSAVLGKRDPEAEIISAMWTVLGGGVWMTRDLAAVMAGDEQRPRLSDQEERALVLYASGLTLAAVADQLKVAENTAKTYIDRVKEKYSAFGRPARTKVELSRVAVADGYLNPAASPTQADF